MNEIETKKISEIEVFDYNGENYKEAMNFEHWRVAYLNSGDVYSSPTLDKIERHLLTDEVFVLLEGKATLYIGKQLDKIEMEPYKIYNVPKGVWHNIRVTKGTKTLIVENHDTSVENSEYIFFE